jgi:enterochelin esterase-like enzyme
MRKILPLIVILSSLAASGGKFSHFISYVRQLPLENRQAKADSFLATNPVVPFAENDTTIYFLYKGTAEKPVLAGDFTNWAPALPMTRLEGTDLWYCLAHFESDARIEYKIVDNTHWFLDPLNPGTVTGGTGSNSELRMPSWKNPPELSYYPDIPHGSLFDTSFSSKVLKNTRKVRIYLPPGYSGMKQYPVALFHDGLEFITFADVCNILDYLTVKEKIEPLIGIFVPPVDRGEEYSGKQKEEFSDFITGELMPEIDRKYSATKDPVKRANFGISSGGNIALFIGIKHPEIFGKVSAQSSEVQDVITSYLRKNRKLNLEFYIDIGTYDIRELYPMVDSLTGILDLKKYSYTYMTWHEGHSWANWRSHLKYALELFFPRN